MSTSASFLSHVNTLVRNDFRQEWREKYSLNGIVLYVLATLMVLRFSFDVLRTDIWLALYWIVLLFAAVNAAAKSFLQEARGATLFLYQLASPTEVLVSRFIYNLGLLLLIALLAVGGLAVLFGFPIEGAGYFALVVLLGTSGFSATFTMVSAIASRARASATLVSILSFPLILPQLMLILKLSHRAADGIPMSANLKELVALLAINAIVYAISIVLFPYLWRD